MVNDDGSNHHHHHHSAEMSFRLIKQDSRFFSRLMAKETSSANSSSRVFYYGEKSVAAVPFLWEEQPGTPKHPLSETSLPPLTPPPSYYSNSSSNDAKGRSSRASVFSSALVRFAGSRKSHVSPSSLSSWSPSSSISSSSSGSFSGSRSPSSSTTLKHKCSSGFRGCYPFGNT